MPVLFKVFAGLALLSAIMVIRAKNPVYSVLFLILVFCNAAGLLLLIHLDFFAMVFLVVYVGAIAVLFLFVVMMLNITLAEINDTVLRYLPIGGLFGILFLSEILLLLEQDLVPILVFNIQGFPFFELLTSAIRGIIVTVFYMLWALYAPSTGLTTSFASYLRSRYNETMEVLHTCSVKVSVTQNECNDVCYVIWPHTMEQTSTIHTLGHVVYTSYMAFFIMASLILLISMIGAIVLTMHKGVSVKRQEVFEQNTRDFSKTLQKIKNT